MATASLYIVLLGGKHANARIEVHDIVPVITHKLTDAYAELKQQWFGLQKGLHIDGWMHITNVCYAEQNYQVVIKDDMPKSNALKLFLINLGAYLPEQFGEIHKYVVVAAHDVIEAKQQGKKEIEKHWVKAHTDAIIDIDDCILLDMFNRKYIYLEKTDNNKKINEFKNDYILI